MSLCFFQYLANILEPTLNSEKQKNFKRNKLTRVPGATLTPMSQSSFMDSQNPPSQRV